MHAQRMRWPLLAALLWLAAAHGADFSTPRGRVQDAVDRVVAVLREPGLDRDTRWQRIPAVIDAGFDFRTMSQSVLATQWRKATPEERDQFTRYFSRYIEQVYREQIEAYAGQEIVYGRELVQGDRASVELEIRTATTAIPVTFRLRSDNGNWLAYDVIIEGVSLVASYRGTFAAISRNEGMDAIMADIRERVARHRERQIGAERAAP
jgi:phospholipid transport system substrate-binding protein